MTLESIATLESASPMNDPLALGVEDRAWVDRQLAMLSAEEKVGQLFIFAAEQDTLEEVAGLAALKPGGIHRFPGHDLTKAWASTRAAIDSARAVVERLAHEVCRPERVRALRTWLERHPALASVTTRSDEDHR